jgi:hypothetical protein
MHSKIGWFGGIAVLLAFGIKEKLVYTYARRGLRQAMVACGLTEGELSYDRGR